MSDQERTAPSTKKPVDRDAARRPYRAPSLVEYGSIARLTHSGGSTVKEGAVPSMNHGCL